ncbi:MAG: hypothetical protein GY866_34565 [Proteobacteria bacterium]|nr:hypothetical protein [Pseudomonadota bacterium]
MEMSRSDRIAILNTCIAILGFIVVIYQLHAGNRQYERAQLTQRAQFLAELHERGFGSRELMDIFQKIEYGDFDYFKEYHNTDEQKSLFKLLSFFEFIGQLENLGLIEKEDVFGIFGYYIHRTYKNPEIKKCLNYLNGLAKNRGKISSSVSFPLFQQLGEELTKREGGLNP